VFQQPNITIFEDHFAIDLITTRKLGVDGLNRCVGAYVLAKDQGAVETFAAPAVALATGGCGKVTSTPPTRHCDRRRRGHGVPRRAAVANMEFIQFHPTCLYHPKPSRFSSAKRCAAKARC